MKKSLIIGLGSVGCEFVKDTLSSKINMDIVLIDSLKELSHFNEVDIKNILTQGYINIQVICALGGKTGSELIVPLTTNLQSLTIPLDISIIMPFLFEGVDINNQAKNTLDLFQQHYSNIKVYFNERLLNDENILLGIQELFETMRKNIFTLNSHKNLL